MTLSFLEWWHYEPCNAMVCCWSLQPPWPPKISAFQVAFRWFQMPSGSPDTLPACDIIGPSMKQMWFWPMSPWGSRARICQLPIWQNNFHQSLLVITWSSGNVPRYPRSTGHFHLKTMALFKHKLLMGAPAWPGNAITLWLFNITMENGPFIVGLPI